MIFFFTSCHLGDNEEKYDRIRWVAYDNIIQCRNDGINIPDNYGKNTETHS